MPRFADEQLLKAASEGDLSGVEQALRSGADVDAKGTYNDTALNGACTWGHTEVVKRLLEAGADVENKGGAEHDAQNAASRRHFEIVQLLLQKGARVSDDLLSIIQTKVNILEENAEAGMVLWEGVEAWKGLPAVSAHGEVPAGPAGHGLRVGRGRPGPAAPGHAGAGRGQRQLLRLRRTPDGGRRAVRAETLL
jgi:hypothetical protein